VIGSSDQKLHAKFLEDLFDWWPKDMLPLMLAIILIGNFERYELLDAISEKIKKHISFERKRAAGSGKPLLRSILNELKRGLVLDFLDEEDDTGRGLELLLDVFTEVHIEQQARGVMKTALFGTLQASNEMLQPTKTSESPTLHTLVSRNAPNALSVFLDLSPNLAAVDIQGDTALHIAAAGNCVACARQLLKLKIDVDVENNDGKTARQIAVEEGHTEISEEIDLTSVVAVIEGSVGMG
jgi:Ankyrin repeats (3 copies)